MWPWKAKVITSTCMSLNILKFVGLNGTPITPIRNWMITWLMMSRNPERPRSYIARIIWSLISQQQFKIAGWCQWNTCRKLHSASRLLIGCWHDNVVCLSIHQSLMRCTVAKRYILQQVSEQVNRKCPLGTPFYSFQPIHRSYLLKLPTSLTHRFWCHQANKFKPYCCCWCHCLAGKGRSIAQWWPRLTTHLQRSAGGRLLSFRIW